MQLAEPLLLPSDDVGVPRRHTWEGGSTSSVAKAIIKVVSPVLEKVMAVSPPAAAYLEVIKEQSLTDVDVLNRGPTWREVSWQIMSVLISGGMLGLLGLPYALQQVGETIGIVLIAGVAITTCLSAKMLVWSLDLLVAGRMGKCVMRAALLTECYGFIVCSLVVHVMNWPVVLGLIETDSGIHSSSTREDIAAIVCVAAFLSSALPQSKCLNCMPSVGLVAAALLFIALVVAPEIDFVSKHAPCPMLLGDKNTSTLLAEAPLSESETSSQASITHENHDLLFKFWRAAPVATGILLFCFSGHVTLPELYHRMPMIERPCFDIAVNRSFSAAFIFYGLFAALGVVAYRTCTAECITFNLMVSAPTFGRIATAGMLACTFTTIPLRCKMMGCIAMDLIDDVNCCFHTRCAIACCMRSPKKMLLVESLPSATEEKANSGAEQVATPMCSKPSLSSSASGGSESTRTSKTFEDAAQSPSAPSSSRSFSFAISWLLERFISATFLGMAANFATYPSLSAKFDFTIALFGLLSTMMISFIAPPLIFTWLNRFSLSHSAIVLYLLLVVLGVVAVVAGLSSVYYF